MFRLLDYLATSLPHFCVIITFWMDPTQLHVNLHLNAHRSCLCDVCPALGCTGALSFASSVLAQSHRCMTAEHSLLRPLAAGQSGSIALSVELHWAGLGCGLAKVVSRIMDPPTTTTTTRSCTHYQISSYPHVVAWH